MRVILLPAQGALTRVVRSRFYVAGDITGLQVVNMSAYGIDGTPVLGINAAIAQND